MDHSQRESELEALYRLAEQVSLNPDLDGVLSSALDSAKELICADAGGVLVLEPTTQELGVRAHFGVSPSFLRMLTTIEANQGMMPRMLQEAVSLQDMAALSQPRQRAMAKEGLQTLMTVPLRVDSKVFGVLMLATYDSRILVPNELELLSAIGRQVGIAMHRADLHDQKLRAAILEERRAMARQMHDDTAQTLSYLGLKIDTVMTALNKISPPEVMAELETCRTDIDRAFSSVRSLITRLQHDLPLHLDFRAALQETVAEFQEQTGCPVRADYSDEPLLHVPPLTAYQATYIIRESLVNVRKHSQADEVSLTVEKGERGALHVIIHDNGRGFDPGAPPADADSSFGLRFMRQRAEYVGGELEITSSPGQGTSVLLRLAPN